MSPNSPLSALGLSPKTAAALTNAGLATVSDVLLCSDADLVPIGLGDKARADLVDALALCNLQLRRDEPVPETAEIVAVAAADHGPLDEPSWLTEPLPIVEPSASTTEAEAVARELFNYGIPKRAKKRGTLTDDERAHKYVQRRASRASNGPRLDDPDDIARLRELRIRPTMEPIDAAWMYGVSIDVVYSELKAGRIPHTKFGTRYKVTTAEIFGKLLPDWQAPVGVGNP